MQYYGGGSSQRTGIMGFGFNDFSIQYENDYHVKNFTDAYKLTDGGDRFRTAALRATYREISAGFNLFTGDPGVENRETVLLNGQNTYIEKTKQYRLGAAYVGYKNIKIGANSEAIRHKIQNRLAHDMLKPGTPHFQVLNNNWSFYSNIGNNNPYSLW